MSKQFLSSLANRAMRFIGLPLTEEWTPKQQKNYDFGAACAEAERHAVNEDDLINAVKEIKNKMAMQDVDRWITEFVIENFIACKKIEVFRIREKLKERRKSAHIPRAKLRIKERRP